MKTKFKLIISMALIVATLAGCSAFMPKEKVELNQRQIAILEKEGKPTKWSKLRSYEKQSIQTIEEMLVYLENKYNKEFCYAYFKMADFITGESDSLLAYAKGDNPETDLFEVHEEEGKFVDDYGIILSADSFQAEVDNTVKELLSGYEYRLFTDVGSVDDNNKVLGASVELFIAYPKDDENLVHELQKAAFTGVESDISLTVYYVNNDFLDGLTKYNWEDRYNDELIIARYFEEASIWRKENG
ncbi:MAG: hypothetical protein K6A61_11935 [Butyrivibrio sp.]|nr:hypothetical protein [Butyrivibrio sp.]